MSDGILVALEGDDPRSQLIENYQRGVEAEIHVVGTRPKIPRAAR